jgi:putative zinc-binding metallo-peptidase
VGANVAQPVTAPARLAVRRQPAWARWRDEQLLDLRLRDLRLDIAGTMIERRIAQLYRELAERRIRFRPHFWFSDEWFTPDGVPGIAVPFYLGHPRLARLELAQMLEIEGGTPDWCMRILRHETGHAIENAFRLRRRRDRRSRFGRSSQRYPQYYTPKPYSRSYVVHLEPCYAQAHPDEDFAETFAVWLAPGSAWRSRYAGWPALKKLEYMDELMAEIGPREPPVTSRRTVDALPRLGRTLREHYLEKRQRLGAPPSVPDRDLRRVFAPVPAERATMTAARFLGHVRADVRRLVARCTGEYQYTIDRVLDALIERCRTLRLRLVVPPERAKAEVAVLVAVQTMNWLHSGQHRVWL